MHLSKHCLTYVLSFTNFSDLHNLRLVSSDFNFIVKELYERLYKIWTSYQQQLQIQIQTLQNNQEQLISLNQSQKNEFFNHIKLSEKDLQTIRKSMAHEELEQNCFITIKSFCAYLNNGYLIDIFNDEQLVCLQFLKHPNILKQTLKYEDELTQITEIQLKILEQCTFVDESKVSEESMAIFNLLRYLQNLYQLLTTQFYVLNRKVSDLQCIKQNCDSNLKQFEKHSNSPL